MKIIPKEIAAFVTMKPGSNYIKSEIEDYISQNLAKFKRPKYLYIIEQMPLNASGKILKRELVAMYNEQFAAATAELA